MHCTVLVVPHPTATPITHDHGATHAPDPSTRSLTSTFSLLFACRLSLLLLPPLLPCPPPTPPCPCPVVALSPAKAQSRAADSAPAQLSSLDGLRAGDVGAQLPREAVDARQLATNDFLPPQE
jgi:hypothetical protein